MLDDAQSLRNMNNVEAAKHFNQQYEKASGRGMWIYVSLSLCMHKYEEAKQPHNS